MLFTDGIVEAKKHGGAEEFGVQRLLEVARQAQGRRPADVVTAIFDRLGEILKDADSDLRHLVKATYYVVGLIHYLAKGLQSIGWPWSAEVTAACAIPAVGLGVWLSLRRLHATLLHD